MQFLVSRCEELQLIMASSIPSPNEIEIVGDTTEEGPKWIRKKGPIALRSKVWEHIKEKKGDKTTVKCDHCPKIFKYSSSTTGIKYHLESVHHINLKDPGNEGNSSKDLRQAGALQMSIEDAMSNRVKMALDEVIISVMLFDKDQSILYWTLPNFSYKEYAIVLCMFAKAK